MNDISAHERDLSVDNAIDSHLHYLLLADLAPSTIRRRAEALRRMERIMRRPLLMASGRDIIAWRSAMTVSTMTAISYISHARAFYNWALKHGYICRDPMEGIPVPRAPRYMPRPISEDDLATALRHAPDRIRPWIALAAGCGLRAKEIALLRRSCVMDKAPAPAILVASDATKGRYERVVFLAPPVLGELYRAGLSANGWVFRRLDGADGPNSPARVSWLANRYLHEIGISATLHMCRHRFGTQLYAVHKDLRMVQEMMGHQSPAATQGYADWNRQSAIEAVALMPFPIV
ncbi:MAG TPA: tyrosine-type recombinase/integrase [Streptosporangiaceae bacterium]|jgi:integrase/recombinase XerC